MSVRKRKNRWHYDFQVCGVRHRGSIPEARNKAQAERAEAKLKHDLFERRFGGGISKSFAEFVAEAYEPWAKSKRSYRSEQFFIQAAVAHFKNFALDDIRCSARIRDGHEDDRLVDVREFVGIEPRQ